MLWWVPPTSVTLVLRVEKSKSRHAQHALETTQLRSTCILGEKHPPFARTTASLELYAATVDLPPVSLSLPVNPREWKRKGEGGGERRERESKVTYADRLKHSWQCVQAALGAGRG